jgi:hypothetical protein
MDFIFVLCMNNGYRNAFQQAKCDEPALAIRETIVFESERRASEDILCVNEVDVVSLQIASTFPRIPRESHMQIVYTNLAMRKPPHTPPRCMSKPENRDRFHAPTHDACGAVAAGHVRTEARSTTAARLELDKERKGYTEDSQVSYLNSRPHLVHFQMAKLPARIVGVGSKS